MLSLVALLVVADLARSEEDRLGERIYVKQCASCHGANGQGAEDYPHALLADRSREELAKYITRRMPKGEPELCEGAEAEAVADHILGMIKERPRIEPARLTVRQHHNALSDLIATFRPNPTIGTERGLRGQYYRSERFRGRPSTTRTDPVIDFDFKSDKPVSQVSAEEYGIRWDGAILAEETGDHEIIVRSENGFRLWVNDNGKPRIDAGVRSGNEVERRVTVPLLGGRAYPLRLEMFKSKKGKEKTAAVSLLWKPPHGVEEVIPTRFLVPELVAEVFVPVTAFPPDDRSRGWERGTTVSKAWAEAVTTVAMESAQYVAEHRRELTGGREERDFAARFVARAFRRPLSEAERAFFIDRQFEAVSDGETALKRVVLLGLKSPRFLYRRMDGKPDAHAVASRLAFALWDSLPDEPLLRAAAEGKLTRPEEVRAQAARMLEDPRAELKLRRFFTHWLDLEHRSDLTKDSERFPQFDEEVVADLRASLFRFLEEGSDFRQLFLAEHVWLNGRLARLYGADLPEDAPFQKMVLNKEHRAGVLTHPYLMVSFAYSGTSSPIHRGVLLAREMLGITLRPPPEAFTPLPEKLHPDLTTRERVTLQTKPESCVSCHGLINPLGFTLENFDAIGRFRERENGKPIDARGAVRGRDDSLTELSGPRDLGRFLAQSPQAHEAFVERMFHHLVQQPVRAYGPNKPEELRERFAEVRFDIRKLMIEIAVTATLGERGVLTP